MTNLTKVLLLSTLELNFNYYHLMLENTRDFFRHLTVRRSFCLPPLITLTLSPIRRSIRLKLSLFISRRVNRPWTYSLKPVRLVLVCLINIDKYEKNVYFGWIGHFSLKKFVIHSVQCKTYMLARGLGQSEYCAAICCVILHAHWPAGLSFAITQKLHSSFSYL